MQPTPLRHRAELWKLAFIELWERFGFYVMLDLLVMMLISVMGMTKGDASDVYGKWNAAVYLAPLLGGYLADRYLGYRKSVLLGATIMAAGYLSMAAAFYLKQIYGVYGSMVVIVLGNGLFKPNMSALVGNLYPAGDKRTDSAFSIFYVAVNIGALAAPMAAATIRHHYSMPVAIMAAGLGMLVAVAGTLYSWRAFAAMDRTSSVAAITGIALPAEYDDAPEPPKVEREKIRSIVVFCAIVMAFWIAFHQNGSTLTYWAADNTDLTLGGLMSLPWLAKALNMVGWSKG
jgi:POT family proton-dependent oligopeptide transporter